MEHYMSELTIKLILLILPGAISALIVETLTIHKEWKAFRFILYSTILGLSSYLATQLLFYFIAVIEYPFTKTFSPSTITFWQVITYNSTPLEPQEILLTCLWGIILGVLVSKMSSSKILNILAEKYKISRKYGSENLYTYFLNSDAVDWINVRDKENNLTYQGEIQSYSEKDVLREMVLRNVIVYNTETGAELYKTPAVYLTFSTDKFIIELPFVPDKEDADAKSNQGNTYD